MFTGPSGRFFRRYRIPFVRHFALNFTVTNTMSEHETQLLRLIRVTVKRVQAYPETWTHGMDFRKFAIGREAKKLLPFVQVSADWLGADAAGRQRRKRVLAALVEAGRIEIVTPAGGRVQFVRAIDASERAKAVEPETDATT